MRSVICVTPTHSVQGEEEEEGPPGTPALPPALLHRLSNRSAVATEETALSGSAGCSTRGCEAVVGWSDRCCEAGAEEDARGPEAADSGSTGMDPTTVGCTGEDPDPDLDPGSDPDPYSDLDSGARPVR